MTAQNATRMTSREKKSSITLASIFALRMLGLFVILPVFAVYAHDLPGGDDAFMVGLTLGIYGLAQGVLQIPLGAASDRFGRKPVILAGLVVFAAGSLIAASADTIWGIFLGRAVQGAGAISAAVTAFISDSVRHAVITRAMAMVGASIGLTFALSMVIAPPLARLWGLPGIFLLTGVLAVAAVFVVRFIVPEAPGRHHEPEPDKTWREIALEPQLLRLNIGIFVLHAALMAVFVVIPTRLTEMGLPSEHHWWVYLPAVLAGFTVMAPLIIIGERRNAVVRIMRWVLGFFCAAFVLFAYLMHSIWEISFLLGLFFSGFNVLEATLPSLISRLAPPRDKGLALGIYNTLQNFGLFAGGALGGWITLHWGAEAVFFTCAFAMLLWLASAIGMKEPPRSGREPEEA
ncbi:MFS transporter [uncultured Sutterella sp.]|uniref:MFS transporter n=1 Tax=uncultured Sutterella sp. TaxID=286133 RepID=UPI0025FBDD33|nr:MFS transporter [uncultured Sutterella sp.]